VGVARLDKEGNMVQINDSIKKLTGLGSTRLEKIIIKEDELDKFLPREINGKIVKARLSRILDTSDNKLYVLFVTENQVNTLAI
jgi:hypothetical protein